MRGNTTRASNAGPGRSERTHNASRQLGDDWGPTEVEAIIVGRTARRGVERQQFATVAGMRRLATCVRGPACERGHRPRVAPGECRASQNRHEVRAAHTGRGLDEHEARSHDLQESPCHTRPHGFGSDPPQLRPRLDREAKTPRVVSTDWFDVKWTSNRICEISPDQLRGVFTTCCHACNIHGEFPKWFTRK